MSGQPPPSVKITIPLEGGPMVIASYRPEDEERMLFWLRARPELLRLVREAIELQWEGRES
jgi:hypothetical protein